MLSLINSFSTTSFTTSKYTVFKWTIISYALSYSKNYRFSVALCDCWISFTSSFAQYFYQQHLTQETSKLTRPFNRPKEL